MVSDPLAFEPIEEIAYRAFYAPVMEAYALAERRLVNARLTPLARKHPSLVWLLEGRSRFREPIDPRSYIQYNPEHRWDKALSTPEREAVARAFGRYDSWRETLIEECKGTWGEIARAYNTDRFEVLTQRSRGGPFFTHRLLAEYFANGPTRRGTLREVLRKKSAARRYFGLLQQEFAQSVMLARTTLPLLAKARESSIDQVVLLQRAYGVVELGIGYTSTAQFGRVTLPDRAALAEAKATLKQHYDRELQLMFEEK